MMYEGIVSGALDFDYAPAVTLISARGVSRRVWLNISQEGKAAVDERKLLNGLKLTSVDFQPITAYQVSELGMQFLAQIPPEHCKAVDAFVHVPHSRPREVMVVRFKPGAGFSMNDEYEDQVEDHGIDLLNDPDALEKMAVWEEEQKRKREALALKEAAEREQEEATTPGPSGSLGDDRVTSESTVTDTEDVSYVSSPIFPSVLEPRTSSLSRPTPTALTKVRLARTPSRTS